MMDPTVMQIGNVIISVSTVGTTIQYPDGSCIPGAPEDTEGYRQTARRYGYDADTLQLCLDHEVTHVALANWLGLDESPTMRALRTACLEHDLALRRLEENAVLAVQHYARAAGVDIISNMALAYPCTR